MALLADSPPPLDVGAPPVPGSGDLINRVGLAVVALAVLAGIATFFVLTGLTPVQPSPEMVKAFLFADAVLVALMLFLVGWQIRSIMVARRREQAGAGLHIKMVALLALFAAVPALIVALFASVTLNRGLDAWFSERTQNIVNRAESVAEAYINEQKEVARGDISFISEDLSRQKQLFDTDREQFIRRLATHAAFRSLSGAFLIDAGKRRVEASATANNSVTFRPPDPKMIEEAGDGQAKVFGPDGNVIRGLVKVPNFDDRYLYVYRLVDPSVIEQLGKAREAKTEYDRMMSQRAGLQLTFGLVYLGLASMFLLAATWLGIWFANRLANPIGSLVGAARRVADGDYDAKVDVGTGKDDLATLASTFNAMTGEIKAQRTELMSANQQLDERRRFTEAVLSGVSAGVIGLDSKAQITLANRSASALLGIGLAARAGQPVEEVVPEIAPILKQAQSKASGTAEGQVAMRVGTQERNFVVRVTTEKSREDEHGYVVTFDDISELVTAQRNSAWADIARRIAHEIKNPLTPIQLAAERLKRKYGKEITSDPTVFEQCTSTIIRQVGDIGRMVDEFSSFARMPAAVLEMQDLGQIVREATVLQRESGTGLDYALEVPEKGPEIAIDRRLVTQAVTNLVKNAGEAIEARVAKEPEPKGRIEVKIVETPETVAVEVIDNGVGLPKENRGRLTEPYVTTREKGTGLGLAIVKRIMEEHGGKLTLTDAYADPDDGSGAKVSLVFPKQAAPGHSSVAG
ncbi:MAG: PAS domain-containing sensor histidine kinase [Hyphomicrobiales bacterium]